MAHTPIHTGSVIRGWPPIDSNVFLNIIIHIYIYVSKSFVNLFEKGF